MRTFKELGLSKNLLQAIKDLGFEQPSEIQEQSIPVLLESQEDYVGLAQTGTGKTAAFGLPIIQQIDSASRAIQALVMCPTRELCVQISEEMKLYAKYSDAVKVVAVYGGASIQDQIRSIKKGANVVIGTPGRTIDLIERKALKFDQVSKVVLDEADEMLNMGFKEDINKVLRATPAFKKVWLFSATMPKEVEKIANTYMTDPHKVVVGTKNSSAKNIDHRYCLVNGRDKYFALKRFIDYTPNMFGIVFCRTRRETKDVTDRLTNEGYNVDALHGDLSQTQRDLVMNKFRNKNLNLLVATDVAARGIDVDDVTHVFHYELPDETESYTHRSGRTARAGKSGVSIALVSPSKSNRIRLVEKQIGKKLELIKAPTGDDICGAQLLALIQNVKEVEVNKKGIAPFLPKIYENLEGYDKDELIEKFVSLEFNRFLKAYERAKDINVSSSKIKKGKGDEKSRRRSGTGSDRLFINVGKIDGFENKGQLLGFICNQSGVSGNAIGKIDLFKSFSFINIDKGIGEDLIKAMDGRNIEGREVKVEFSKDRPKGANDGERRGRRKDSSGNKGKKRNFKERRKRS